MPDLAHLTDLTQLTALAAGAYVVVLLFTAADAVFAVLPAETVVIGSGVLAASGDLHMAAIMPSAAVGALTGDCAAYALGRRASRVGMRRMLKARRGRQLIRWAATALEHEGGMIVLTARFVPGGRTSTALAAGFLRFPLARYRMWAAIGGLLWSAYAAGLGYVGGRTFTTHPLLALLVALAMAGAIGLLALTAISLRDTRPGERASDRERASAGHREAGDTPQPVSCGRDRPPERRC